jgi:hypothetical protein
MHEKERSVTRMLPINTFRAWDPVHKWTVSLGGWHRRTEVLSRDKDQ